MLYKIKKNFWIALVFIIFGFLTIISGGKNLFSESGIKSNENIVPLVLWFNFIAGFFYFIAGILIFKLKPCVKRLSFIIAILNVIVLFYFINHVFQGGLFEKKTVFAMSFRTLFWVCFAIYFQKSDFLKKIKCHC